MKRHQVNGFAIIIVLILRFDFVQVLSTRLFGKRSDPKLKSVTIIHSSTTETVRLPADGDNQNVTVHPAAVRSKLPLKKRVREKRNVNNNNNNNSPAKKSRKKVTVEEESTTETSSPKKVAQSQKKERKTRRKKSKGVIDYSVAQNKVLIASKKTPEDDPLGKVRNWLLNSHHIEALGGTLRKSKSSPAGFANPAEPPKQPVPRAQQKTKDNQVSLQVVYKPPFKFSVKLSKSKPDLAKEKRPDRAKQRAALLIRANRAHGGVKPMKKLNRSLPPEPKPSAAAREEPIYENTAIDLLRMSSTEHDGHQPIFPVAASPPRKQRQSFAGVEVRTEETAAGRSKRNSVPQQLLQPGTSSSGGANNLMRFPSTENKAVPTYANASKSEENRKDDKT